MSAAIDGFQLLGNIGKGNDLFKCIEKEIHKSALALAKKFLKSKGLDLGSLCAFREAVTDDVFLLLLDGCTTPEIRTLAKKIDKYYPDIALAAAATLRSRLYKLATSEETPYPKPAPAPRTKKAAPKKSPPPVKAGAKWPDAMGTVPNNRRK